MTPAARVQAAIEILDRISPHCAAEQALTNWARGARFAGSKDRAAVRDHVFDVLRQKRSTAALGGGFDGRRAMLGLLRAGGVDPETIFTGAGYAPAPLGPEETSGGRPPSGAEMLDLPDWLAERFQADLGPQAQAVAEVLRSRAPMFLRVNSRLSNPAQAIESLERDSIQVIPSGVSRGALKVVTNSRRLRQAQAYREGWVEIQDASSQAVVDLLPMPPGGRVLDFCAGGGGKTLAMAARLSGPIDAHDANAGRLRDLPVRAARAAANVRIVAAPGGGYDLVLCDVPCSGSGAWRRSPEGKWTLTPERLDDLHAVQAGILQVAARSVTSGGCLAYVTCSVFTSENMSQIQKFTANNSGWTVSFSRQFLPSDEGDGFFVCCLARG